MARVPRRARERRGSARQSPAPSGAGGVPHAWDRWRGHLTVLSGAVCVVAAGVLAVVIRP